MMIVGWVDGQQSQIEVELLQREDPLRLAKHIAERFCKQRAINTLNYIRVSIC